MAAVREFHALHAAVSRRRAVSGHRLSESQQDLRSRLFRRSVRGGVVRACISPGHVRVTAGKPDRRAASSVVRGKPALVLRAREPARHGMAHRGGARLDRCAFHAAAAPGYSEAGGLRLQRRRLCAQIPRRRARVRKRVSIRIPRDLRQLVSAFRAGAFRQCGLHSAEHAGQRLSRHVHRWGRTKRHHPRSAGGADGVLPLSADDLSLCDQVGAGHLRGSVRRRHLHIGRLAQFQERHGRGGKPRRARGFSHRQGSARVHRRRTPQFQAAGHRL